MDIQYKFALDQRVITPFGEEGIVAMAGTDSGGNHFFVKTKNVEGWHKESLLEAA